MSYTKLESQNNEDFKNDCNENWRASRFRNRKTITDADSPYTIWQDDVEGSPLDDIEIDATSGNVDINLISASLTDSDALKGRPIRFVRKDSSGNTVTIIRDGSDTIGYVAANKTLASAGKCLQVVPDAVSNWDILTEIA